MPNRLRTLVIGTELPSEPIEHWSNFAWLNPADRTIKEYVNGHWVEIATLADTFKTEGYTGEIKDGKNTFVFENGILIKYG